MKNSAFLYPCFIRVHLWRRSLFVVSLLFAFALSHAAPNPYRVHFVYLVPTDKQPIATQAITNAALHLQAWYRWQMGNGKTFTLHDPIVEVYLTPHDSNWYSTNPCCQPYYDDPFSAWWWDNVLIEAHELTLDPNAQGITGVWYCCEGDMDDYVVYCDAPPAVGQYAGAVSSGIMGVAMMADADLRSLMGIDPDWTQCRGIGGSGHEFGHTFNLAHPPPPPNPEWYTAIMGLGYMSYPNAILTQADKDLLNTSPFFAYTPYLPAPASLCPFADGYVVPAAPHLNGPSQIQITSFTASWHTVNGATNYRLDVAGDNHFLNYVLQDLDVGNVLSVLVNGLTTRTDYYYRLRAYNYIFDTTSPNSSVVHVKTK